MKIISHVLAAAMMAAIGLSLTGCGDSGGGGGAKPKVVLGIVAKSQSNPVFQAAHQGAKDAAKELGSKYGVDIEINIQTPTEEDAQKQAQAVEQLARSGVAGIAVSCSNANTLQSAIDKAVELGVPVMCFDSDSPKSKRFAYYGTDDLACGERVGKDLAQAMDDKGNVAILAGNQAAPNLQSRQKALRDELAKHPNIKVIDTVYHEETPEKAAAAVQREQSAHPEINGWGFIGGWPLWTRDALKWEPGTVKVVSVDALPPQLEYLKTGHVQILLAQDCYGWGHRSVEILMEKIKNGKEPADPRVIDPLAAVTKDGGNGTVSADAFAKNWDKWLGK